MVILALAAPVFAAGGTAQVFYDFSESGGSSTADDGNFMTNNGTLTPQAIGGGVEGAGIFTGPSGTITYTGNYYNGGDVALPVNATSKFGGALWFHGGSTNHYAQFTSTFDLSTTGSLSMFVNIFDVDRRGLFITNESLTFASAKTTTGGTVMRRIGNVGEQWTNAQPLPVNTWHHLVMTWDTSVPGGTNRFYWNGTKFEEGDMTLGLLVGPTFLNQRFRLGYQGNFSGLPGNTQLKGGIDDVAFYSGELSPADIAVIATGSAAAVTANQVVYWNLDNATGTTLAASNGGSVATDLLVGANSPASITQYPVFVPLGGPVLPGSGGTLDAISMPDKSVDENVARIEMDDSPTLDWNKARGTITMWLNPTYGDVNAGAGVGGEETTRTLLSDSTGNFEIRVNSGGRLWFKTTSTGGTAGTENWAVTYRLFPSLDGQSALNQDVWSHWAFVWDETVAGGTMAIYRNGILMDLANSNGFGCTNIVGSLGGGGRDCAAINPNGTGWTSSGVNTGDWFIGARAQSLSQQYEGDLADFGMFTTALTLAEIQEIYNFGIESFIEPVQEPQPQPQPAPGAIPEPATLSLLTLSILAIARRRRT